MADDEAKDQDLGDDWAAAMAEQASSESGAGAEAEPSAADDWAAAMAEQAAEDAAADTSATPANIFQQFSSEPPMTSASTGMPNLDLVLDIPVNLTVELGRTKIAIRNLLQLAQGSVVELDGLAGEPMNVLVNGCLIAQGEVVVVNDKFGIRLTDIISPSERIRKLNR